MTAAINLRSKIITVLLTVSLLPIIIMGIGAWIVFGRLLEERSIDLQKAIVESHADAIESYLSERMNSLIFIAQSFEKKDICDSKVLGSLLQNLNDASDSSFQDIGIIGMEGDHLAYVGPYDLIGCNYKNEDWFKHVMAENVYISDVFLGFRRIPHYIIAVKIETENEPWILRSTINSEQFDRIVQSGKIGETGEAFIINRSGLYQTTPGFGCLLDNSQLDAGDIFPDVRIDKVKENGEVRIRVKTWIKNEDWLLVAQRKLSEVRAPVNKAVAYGGVLAGMAMIIIAVTDFFATMQLTNQIDKANRQRDEMYQTFTRTARLASIGELATGLAHEINNPLAIISTNQTNIKDIIAGMNKNSPGIEEIIDSIKISKKQIDRCKTITTRMLHFGRKRDIELKPTEVKPILKDITAMMDRQAKIRNIEITTEISDELPSVILDPVELEQVIINLVHNSFHALPKGGKITISANKVEYELIIEVQDNGTGIALQNRERIFEPFFTTKPVGEGTGLGLSVCYGIVQSWSGKIEVESKLGKGTQIRIKLPLQS